MPVNIRIEIARDRNMWNEAVQHHGTIFHTWEWLKCIERQTKTKLYPIEAYIGDELLCVLPIFVRKSLLTMVFSPPPKSLLLYLGVVFTKQYGNLRKFERAFEDFVAVLNDFISSEFGSCIVRIRSPPFVHDLRPFKWGGYLVTPHYTLSIDLGRELNEIWSSFDKKVRNNIRKTEREGCLVELGEWKELDRLRVMIAERFTAQGMKPTKGYYREYLLELFREFHENMKVFAAKLDGEVVGGFVGLTFRDRFLLWIGIPRVSLKGMYPNDLAIWEGIKWAKENGYRYFEIMDAGDDSRLSRYKSQFNPKPELWFSAIGLFGWLRFLSSPLKRFLR